MPTQQRVGTPSVSAGTRVLAEATGTNEAQTHEAGTQDNAHKSAQTTWFAPVCACARQKGRVSRERRPLTIAHARSRGLLCLWACLRTFVGFLRLVGLEVGVFFGVFGVFSGFLIFLGCDGCGLFGFVLVRFGWGLLCLVLIVFVVLTRLLIL